MIIANASIRTNFYQLGILSRAKKCEGRPNVVLELGSHNHWFWVASGLMPVILVSCGMRGQGSNGIFVNKSLALFCGYVLVFRQNSWPLARFRHNSLVRMGAWSHHWQLRDLRDRHDAFIQAYRLAAAFSCKYLFPNLFPVPNPGKYYLQRTTVSNENFSFSTLIEIGVMLQLQQVTLFPPESFPLSFDAMRGWVKLSGFLELCARAWMTRGHQSPPSARPRYTHSSPPLRNPT